MPISDFFTRRRTNGAATSAAGSGSERAPTKTLPRFLSTLGSRPQPVVVDLGPVVGSNVTFFGERLGCRVVVEDLFIDIDRHAREGRLDALPAFFERRLSHEDDSVDGILCWDVFDYLQRDAAGALADRLTQMLRPEGMLLAFFSTAEPPPAVFRYTKHLVIDQTMLERRPYEAACEKRGPVLSRDVERMFTRLRVAEQFLLKARIREVLFKKPAEQMAVGSDLSAAAH